jgi:hypothetical protein
MAPTCSPPRAGDRRGKVDSPSDSVVKRLSCRAGFFASPWIMKRSPWIVMRVSGPRLRLKWISSSRIRPGRVEDAGVVPSQNRSV